MLDCFTFGERCADGCAPIEEPLVKYGLCTSYRDRKRVRACFVNVGKVAVLQNELVLAEEPRREGALRVGLGFFRRFFGVQHEARNVELVFLEPADG